jgi:hypothetical protein
MCRFVGFVFNRLGLCANRSGLLKWLELFLLVFVEDFEFGVDDIVLLGLWFGRSFAFLFRSWAC